MAVTDEDLFQEYLAKEFLGKAHESIQEIQDSIAQLSLHHDNHAAFRRIHQHVRNLTSSALAAGIYPISGFGKKVNDFTNSLITSEIPFSPLVKEALLEVSETYTNLVELLKKDLKAKYDTSKVTQKLLDVAAPSTAETDEFTEGKSIADVSASGNLVMVVEDDEDVLEMLCQQVQDFGLNTITAENGQDALEQFVKGCRPDLVLTDLKMPKMDGTEILARFKQVAPEIPIIVCSGYAERKDIARFLNSGAFAFLEKPPSEDLMLAAITSALRERRTRQQLMQVSIANYRAYIKLRKLANMHAEGAQKMEIEATSREISAMVKQVGNLVRGILNINQEEDDHAALAKVAG